MSSENVEYPAHPNHDLVLRTISSRTGVRRYPGHVVISSHDIAKELLEGDGDLVTKTTGVNDAIAGTVGHTSLLSTSLFMSQPNEPLEIRKLISNFLRAKSQEYVANVGVQIGALCNRISEERVANNLYDKLLGAFIAGFTDTFDPETQVDVLSVTSEIVAVSRAVGIKSMLGNRIGERVISVMDPERHDRAPEMRRWIRKVVGKENGLWNVGDDSLDRERLESNMITLLGAGTTSASGAVTWTIYDTAMGIEDPNLVTSPQSRRDTTQLMSRVLARHPFGFVINREAARDVSIGGIEIKKGDMVWFVTIPHEQKSDSVDFGISFGHGPRDCVGKSTAIALYNNSLKVWGEHFQGWTVTGGPSVPLYYPTLKPKGLSIAVEPKYN